MIHLSMQKNIVKKIASDVDNYAAFSEKRYQMICQIQNFLKEGCSYREIAKRMGIGRNTIAKYRKGDPKELSIYGIHQSKLDLKCATGTTHASEGSRHYDMHCKVLHHVPNRMDTQDKPYYNFVQ